MAWSRLLLDTHVVLWWVSDPSRHAAPVEQAIADPANLPFVSAASVWEIAIRLALGRLEARDVPWLPVAADHAWAVHDVPPHHRDPFPAVCGSGEDL